ncbi:hypothetical protein ZWY2020_059040 [Hordeum vulgare]|nr:hypothetical protein ZWY2020_059040 [Hordeum vulgare]
MGATRSVVWPTGGTPSRPSPDATRREEDLCQQLSTRDAYRSLPRADHRSLGRASRPFSLFTPAQTWRSSRHRSPSPVRWRDKMRSPARSGRPAPRI